MWVIFMFILLLDLKYDAIQGTRDNTVPPRYGPEILSLLPQATYNRSKLVSFEGAGHDLTLSHGHEVARRMLEFFEKKTK